MVSLAATLRARRQELGLTLTELAKRARLSTSHLSDMEHGRRNIPVSRAWQLAAALDAEPLTWVALALNEELKDSGLPLVARVERV